MGKQYCNRHYAFYEGKCLDCEAIEKDNQADELFGAVAETIEKIGKAAARIQENVIYSTPTPTEIQYEKEIAEQRESIFIPRVVPILKDRVRRLRTELSEFVSVVAISIRETRGEKILAALMRAQMVLAEDDDLEKPGE